MPTDSNTVTLNDTPGHIDDTTMSNRTGQPHQVQEPSAMAPNSEPEAAAPRPSMLRILQVSNGPTSAAPPLSSTAQEKEAAQATQQDHRASSQAEPAAVRNGNLTLSEALDRIQATHITFLNAGLREIQYGGGTCLSIGGECYPLPPEAWQTFCRYMAIPPDLLQLLNPNLGAIVLKALHGAGRRADNAPTELRLARNERGEIVSIAPATLATISNQDIAALFEETLPSHIPSQTLSVASLSLSDSEFELAFHTKAMVTEPRPGDVLHGGITIRHSQAGTCPTVVLGYIHRLVCSNGMTQRVCLRGRPARTKRCQADNSSAPTLEVVKVQLRQAWDQLQERLDGMRSLLEHRMDGNGLPEGLRRRWSINRDVATEIAQTLQGDELGRTGTEYDLVNALSRVATHSQSLAPRYSRHVSLAAGMFAQRHVHQCPMCGTWLADDGPLIDHAAETEEDQATPAGQ